VLVLGKVEAATSRGKTFVRAALVFEVLRFTTIIMHVVLVLLHIYAFLCVAADSNKSGLQNQEAQYLMQPRLVPYLR